MFSPDARLHYVFANKNDTFYCFDSLAPDFERFLWLKLRSQGYAHVYFVECGEDSICVGTFGDGQPLRVVPEKRGLLQKLRSTKAKGDDLCDWILKQLWAKDQDRSAIVFPLKDFCDYFSADARKGFLAKLVSQEKRTGILVLTAPPEAEGSKRYFLNAPVFAQLGEKTIAALSTAKPCDMYSVMYRSMPDRMLFLNLFTAERIRCILARIFLEEPERARDLDRRDVMEAYLLQWMNNPALRDLSKKRQDQLPQPDGLFRDLYTWLKRNENWTLLVAKAMQVSASGGIRNYLGELGCGYVEDPVNTVGIRRAADSYAGRCLRIRLKTATNAEGGEREKIAGLLDEIRRKVLSPRNREENARVGEMIEMFLSELPAADDGGDAGTVRRLLYSVSCCLDWIDVKQDSSEEGAILSVIGQLKNYVGCSALYDTHRRNLAYNRRDLLSGGSKLTELAMRQLEEQEAAARHMLETYEDAVQASVVKLAAAPLSSFTALAKSLSEEILKKNEAEKERPYEPLTEDRCEREEDRSDEDLPDREQEGSEDEDFVLLESDFDINPNYQH